MAYEFIAPGQIIAGRGASDDLAARVRAIGGRALLLESGSAAVGGSPAARLAEQLAGQGLVAARAQLSGEPGVEQAEQLRDLAAGAHCDCVVAIGGGSVIDSAKAAAALLANPGGALDYLEVIGAGRPLLAPALPIVAVPTTAGAGSEATRNAVLRSARHATKASLRHASLMPRLAVVDARLAAGLPRRVVASCGMDALTQLLEAFVSRRAGPLTDGLCREGLALASWALARAYADPGDEPAREAMSIAALLSGMALANAGLGAVHGIAAPLGGTIDAPHGALCAALVAPVTAANVEALAADPAGTRALGRYAEAARMLGAGRTPVELVGWLRELARTLHIPGLAHYGLAKGQIADVATRAASASSTRSNPAALQVEQLAGAITEAL
jgi:alcohol dehydrogenase class IV